LLHNPIEQSVAGNAKIKRYLRLAAKDYELADEANWILAQVCMVDGESEDALRALKDISRPSPEAFLMMAELYGKLGDTVLLLRSSKAAELVSRALISKMSDPSPEARLTLGKALRFQGKFRDALKVLETTVAIEREIEFQAEQVENDLEWFHSLPADDLAMRTERLKHALRLNPNHPELQVALAIIVANTSSEQPNEVEVIAKNALVFARNQKSLSAGALSILGSKSAERGNFVVAEIAFREALAGLDSSPALLNNLAWVLIQKAEPAALDEALELANRALISGPQYAECWKTRAQVWKLKQRPLEAITDLERAISLGYRSSEVRLQLVALYEQSGDPTTAAIYRQKAADPSMTQ